MAIVLSGLPVRAERQSLTPPASQNPASEPNSLVSSKPLIETSAIAKTNEVAVTQERHRVPIKDFVAASEKPVYPTQNLKQADSSSVKLSLENPESIQAIEPVSPHSFIAQGNEHKPSDLETTEQFLPSAPIAQAQPSLPSSETSSTPESADRWQFLVEPYFFVSLDIEADVTVDGRSTSINLGLEDILNLDRAFDA